jgi:hypothetical protein
MNKALRIPDYLGHILFNVLIQLLQKLTLKYLGKSCMPCATVFRMAMTK